MRTIVESAVPLHPLAIRHPRQHVVDHVDASLYYPARGTREADVSAFAAERNKKVVATICAINSGEPMRQDAALEVLAVGGLDMKRNPGFKILASLTAGQVRLQMGLMSPGPSRMG